MDKARIKNLGSFFKAIKIWKKLYYDFFQKLCKLGPAPFFIKFPLIFPLETIQFSIPDKSTLDNARIKNLGSFFWYIQDEISDRRGLWLTAFVSSQIKIVHSFPLKIIENPWFPWEQPCLPNAVRLFLKNPPCQALQFIVWKDSGRFWLARSNRTWDIWD